MTNTWNNSAGVFDGFTYLVPYRQMVERVVTVLRYENPARVLDLGCGTGNIEHQLLGSNLEIIGVDSSEKMLEQARLKCPSVGFEQQDLNQRLRFDDETFDTILSIHSLYMVDDMSYSLREIRRVLKPNGRLILVHPLPRSMLPFIWSHFTSGEFATIGSSILQLPKLVKLFSSGKEVEATKKGNFLERTKLDQLVKSTGLHPTNWETTYGGISTLMIARR